MNKNIIRLLDTPEEIRKIKEDFVEIYSLETNSEQEKAFELIKINPDDYVLKPQREGGGNNFFGNDILEKFQSPTSKTDLQSYILMKKIKSMPRPGILINRNEIKAAGVVSELGIYSYILSSNDNIIENRYGGYLLRTKSYETNEGGVATGYAVLDTLLTLE